MGVSAFRVATIGPILAHRKSISIAKSAPPRGQAKPKFLAGNGWKKEGTRRPCKAANCVVNVF